MYISEDFWERGIGYVEAFYLAADSAEEWQEIWAEWSELVAGSAEDWLWMMIYALGGFQLSKGLKVVLFYACFISPTNTATRNSWNA
jgi:hypothetical protein